MGIKLICLDMDGVLVPSNNFWLELHNAFGTLDEGARLTAQYLHTDYAKLVDEVVGRLWKGRDAAVYHDLVRSYAFSPGIRDLFIELSRFTDEHGVAVPRAIISGGSYGVAKRIADEFGVDFVFANELITEDGKVTGDFRWPVGVGFESKRTIIEQLCEDLEILPGEVLFIGDSDGDVAAFKIVGVGIAFNTKSKTLREVATHIVPSADLRELLPVLRSHR